MKNILIGGAWPYANNSLHVGHLAALLPGDIIARYYRLKGDNVIYVSGTDSHGTPITLRAKKEGVSPFDIVNKYHLEFTSNFEKLDFSYDYYSATMSTQHKSEVQKYFKIIMDNGFIYEKEEEQDYCASCDSYLSDREIIGICPHCGNEAMGEQCDSCLNSIDPSTLTNKCCKVCGEASIVKINTHLYFKLSAFQNKLADYVKDVNWRKNALNETNKYLKMGIIDRAATRHLDWGVDVLVDGYEDKRIYVWIEAVLGYITAASTVTDDIEGFLKNNLTYFVHGKDNITFHTIIYPALITAINSEFCLPYKIISSEYVNMNDEKMSKSKGNLITINDLLDTYDKDSIRFYFINKGPEKKDMNFTDEDFINFHNKFLVGVIGNFVNRNLSFVVKKFNGVIPLGQIDTEIINYTKDMFHKLNDLIIVGELKAASDLIIEYAVMANKYYDDCKPWLKVKEDTNDFYNITYTCYYIIANLSSALMPFIPSTALKMSEMLGLTVAGFDEIVISNDITLNDVNILFERIDKTREI